MQYYRCKCGDSVAWSSMGTYRCEGCSTCNTTLEQHPDHHRTPDPHDWKLQYDPDTGKESHYRCTVCSKRAELGEAMVDIGVD